FSLAVWGLKINSADRTRVVRQIALPIVCCAALTVIGMGYYCWRTTGNPLRTPYQVAQDTYYPTPLFLWQPLRPMPQYHHPAIRSSLQNWELPVYQGGRDHPILMAEA